MQRSRFTEEKIIKILKEAETGKRIIDICREYGVRSRPILKYGSLARGFLFLAITFLFSSLIACSVFCSGHHKLYDDATLQDNAIATLLLGRVGGYWMSVYSVDGKKGDDWTLNGSYYCTRMNGELRIDLSPGHHTLQFDWRRYISDATSKVTERSAPVFLEFEAEAGKVYTLIIKTLDDSHWRGEFVEVPRTPRVQQAIDSFK